MLGIVDYETHFMGDWNGTGACTSHHGSQCCYTDAANLVAAHVADQAKAWSFVHCMFSNQKSLCPKTWDDDKEECGTEDHDDATFQAVKASCTASAKFSDDELKAFDAALGTLSAGDWVHDAPVAREHGILPVALHGPNTATVVVVVDGARQSPLHRRGHKEFRGLVPVTKAEAVARQHQILRRVHGALEPERDAESW